MWVMSPFKRTRYSLRPQVSACADESKRMKRKLNLNQHIMPRLLQAVAVIILIIANISLLMMFALTGSLWILACVPCGVYALFRVLTH